MSASSSTHAAENPSPLANPEETKSSSSGIDGEAFLDQLRGGPRDDLTSHNSDTIGAGNTTKHHQRLDSIAELFGVSAPSDQQIDAVSGAAFSEPNLKTSIRDEKYEPVLPKKPAAISKNHGRSISWDMPEGIEQPRLDENLSSSPSSPGIRPRLPNPRPTRNLSKAISLHDLLRAGPFETEAETAILKAIDERQQSFRRARADSTGTSTIHSSIHDSVHDFVISPVPTRSSDDNPDNDDTEETNGTRSSSMKREQSRPLIHQRKPTHRRSQSVEATLTDLTAAMSALDTTKHARTHHESHYDQEHAVQSSAEDFAHHALMLTQDNASPDTTTGNRNRLWSFVKENLEDIRESAAEQSGSTNVSPDDSTHPPEDIESQADGGNSGHGGVGAGSKKKRKNRVLEKTNDVLKEDWEAITRFFRPRRKHVLSYLKTMIFFVMLPLLGIAAILFYFAGNPSTGRSSENTDPDKASISWILLFCCRQVVTFSAALGMQGLFVDFLGLNTRVLLNLVGPVVTLLIVQAKGWPMIFFWWSIFDFAFLFGDTPAAEHWGHFLEISLFNESNPSGNVAGNQWYRSMLLVGISVSLVVAVKRFLTGLYLGRKTFSHFGKQLAEVMNKMLLVSQVAGLAKIIEKSADDTEASLFEVPESIKWEQNHVRGQPSLQGDDDDTTCSPGRSVGGSAPETVIDTVNRDPLTGSLRYSERLKLMQLLDRWEEPARRDILHKNEAASISAVLQFRKALAFIQKRYPFSVAFGPADSREECIDSCQKVFLRLLKRTPDSPVLPFETIAFIALDEKETVDQQVAKALVKLFRPDREGGITMLDFVKSVDAVYKEFRLLDASIENSSQIDRAFENMFNVVFYIVVASVVLSQLGFDPFALFLSLSSLILGFAFMIGSASSKYFEGVLFILVRRPYGIGDLINAGGTENNTNIDGVMPWVVENVTLFETEVTHLPTNERASLSNGSLASSRIINWARSPQARFHIFLNFPIDTPWEKLVLFKGAIEEYLKARPREWRALNGFRANRIYADKGYIEYLVIVQHRESWQQIGQVLDSKANLTTYSLEVAKQLNMHYKAPPLPVNLNFSSNASEGGPDGSNGEELNMEALTQAFRSSALTKHNIRV